MINVSKIITKGETHFSIQNPQRDLNDREHHNFAIKLDELESVELVMQLGTLLGFKNMSRVAAEWTGEDEGKRENAD